MTSTRMADDTRRLLRRRLQNQLLFPSRRLEPLEIVSHLGAVQAQDYSGAKWALALRSRALREGDVEHSFNSGGILRTHVLRPTWHFVAPADIRWMLALTAPRVKKAMASQFRALDLSERELVRGARIIERALSGGKHLTRVELEEALRRARFTLGGLRLTYLLTYAELEAIVCSGSRQGKQMTHALLEERVPAGPRYDREQSLAELAARYFAGHGPATAADFAWWSGLTITEAKKGIEMIRSRLVRADVDGQTFWERGARSAAPRQTGTSHLLPNWDEYVIGYTKRSVMLPADIAPGVDPRGIVFSNTIAINGRLAGTWRRMRLKDQLVVEVRRARPWSTADDRLLSRAVKDYGAFLQLPVSLTVR